jgi:hypothetical protein
VVHIDGTALYCTVCCCLSLTPRPPFSASTLKRTDRPSTPTSTLTRARSLLPRRRRRRRRRGKTGYYSPLQRLPFSSAVPPATLAATKHAVSRPVPPPPFNACSHAYAALMQSRVTPFGMSCSNQGPGIRLVPVWLDVEPSTMSPTLHISHFRTLDFIDLGADALF